MVAKLRLMYCKTCDILSISAIQDSEIRDSLFCSKFMRYGRNETIILENISYQSSIVNNQGYLRTRLIDCAHRKDIDCVIQLNEIPGSLDKCQNCEAHYSCLFLTTSEEWRKVIDYRKG